MASAKRREGVEVVDLGLTGKEANGLRSLLGSHMTTAVLKRAGVEGVFRALAEVSSASRFISGITGRKSGVLDHRGG